MTPLGIDCIYGAQTGQLLLAADPSRYEKPKVFHFQMSVYACTLGGRPSSWDLGCLWSSVTAEYGDEMSVRDESQSDG